MLTDLVPRDRLENSCAQMKTPNMQGYMYSQNGRYQVLPTGFLLPNFLDSRQEVSIRRSSGIPSTPKSLKTYPQQSSSSSEVPSLSPCGYSNVSLLFQAPKHVHNTYLAFASLVYSTRSSNVSKSGSNSLNASSTSLKTTDLRG